MITVLPYTRGDLKLIPSDDYFPSPDFDDQAERAFHMKTLYLDEFPVCVTAFHPVWDGVVDCFAKIDNNLAGDAALTITRTVQRIVKEYMDDNEVRRLQTVVFGGNYRNIRWCEVLGFQHEGTMYEAAPNGDDLKMYVIRRTH